MPYYKFIPIILLFNLSAYCQKQTIMQWTSNKQLKWADYLGKPVVNSPFDAITVAGDTVFYHLSNVNGRLKLIFTGYSLIDKKKSWVKYDKRSEPLLKHEQLHFDIAEFYFRQLMKTLNNRHFTANFHEVVNIIIKQDNKERAIMDAVYDFQTQHSANLIMQDRWENYIHDLLKNDYSIEEAMQKEPKL